MRKLCGYQRWEYTENGAMRQPELNVTLHLLYMTQHVLRKTGSCTRMQTLDASACVSRVPHHSAALLTHEG